MKVRTLRMCYRNLCDSEWHIEQVGCQPAVAVTGALAAFNALQEQDLQYAN